MSGGSPKSRYVYFIQSECNGLVKIGSTNNPAKRFLELQATSPCPLNLLHLIYTEDNPSHIFELGVHSLFNQHRKHGEWFDLSDPEISFVLGLGPDDYDYLMKKKFRSDNRSLVTARNDPESDL